MCGHASVVGCMMRLKLIDMVYREINMAMELVCFCMGGRFHNSTVLGNNATI